MSTVSDYFGSKVFDDRVMRANLSADVYASFARPLTKEKNWISTSPMRWQRL